MLRHLIRALAAVFVFAGLAAAQTNQATVQGDLRAANECVVLPVQGMGTGAVQLGGTFSGTVSFTVSNDGTTFTAVNMTPPNSSTAVTSATSTGLWSGAVAGYRYFRACMTSYTSGRASAVLSSSLSGGGGGGGGASGSVSITQGGNTAAVNASSQLSVTCANCSGTGVSVNEDVASADGQAGTPAYAVRNDTVTGATSADGDYQPLKSDAAGRLYTTGTGGTFPATQSGTWTVQPGNTANTTAWLVTGTGGTFPATQSGTWNITNVSGTVSLPTGAATSANQSTEITALQLIDNLPNTIGSTTSGQSGALVFGAVTTSAPTYTTGQSHPLSLDTTGALRVVGSSGTTQYAEDAVHASGDSVVAVGTIRRDTTPSSSAGAAGDYAIPATDANGRLYVNATLYNSSGTELVSGDGVEDAAESSGVAGPVVLTVRRDAAATSAGTTGDYATANTDANGLLWTRQLDPCTAIRPTTLPVSAAADAAIITASASNRTYICGGVLAAQGTGETINLWEGTGTACGTGSAALVGSTTEANGIALAANGGFIIPSTIPGLSTNVDVCIRLSATNRVAGYVTYVQAP